MTAPDLSALAEARRQRYATEKAMGWPEDDCRAFLTGARDHWPSMEALRQHLIEEGSR